MTNIRVYPSELDQLEYEIELCKKNKLTDLFMKFREHDKYIVFPVDKAEYFLQASRITISAGGEFVLLQDNK